jgi:regulator of protease activity HflC (stomatin/prohibitin superfamily)
MEWIVFTLIWGALGLSVLGCGAIFAFSGDTQDNKTGGQAVVFLVAPAMFLFWLLVTVVVCFHQVPAGSVGVKYVFGDITGQTDSGLQITPPWVLIKKANVQLQTLAFIDDEGKVPDGAKRVGEGLDSFSNETQNVYIDAIINIEVSPTEIQRLYRTVGPDYVNKLIPGRIAQIFKDETVNYKAVDIAPNREVIRDNVEKQLTIELAPYSIDVKALLIENIAFDLAFEESIVQKQVAQQNALREIELIQAEKAKADQKIEAARGEAGRLIEEARGQAEANRQISSSITPALIQFQYIQKLADNIKIMLVPNNGTLFIDPSKIMGE